MAIDLIGLVKSAISSSGAIDKISGNLGETPAATQTALQASVPALLAAMIGKLSSESGIASLLSLFNSGSYDGSLLSNLGKSLSGSGATSVIDSGKAIAKSLLGDKLSPVANAVASQAGVSATS
ncbi:MAG: DUF937 domain-containing protein, partial [Terriglobales bacterium]